MSPRAQLEAFTQSVYLIIKGRYFDDISSEDGITLMQQTIDWTDMFIDELETEVDAEGKPLDWKWVRQPGFTLGTATQGDASISMPTSVNYLLTGENRYVQITQDGTVVSNWAVVAPDQISNKSNRIIEDMCTVTGSTITFSRAFKDTEANGTIIGDVSTAFPRMKFTIGADGTFNVTNVAILSVVKPVTLLKLGVAKNASLPDIVQGGLSPSYSQKYTDLFNNAVARNSDTSSSSLVSRDDYSSIGGQY